MVMSVNPIRCDTVPRWLTRGMFSSVGWLPFLNCALAAPAKQLNPAKTPKTYLHALRIVAPSSFSKILAIGLPWFSPADRPTTHRRSLHPGGKQRSWVVGRSAGENQGNPIASILLKEEGATMRSACKNVFGVFAGLSCF